MPSLKRKIGDLGEKIAENYLRKSGYSILDRNFQRRLGEIDIIASKDKVITFVEVKTRIQKKTNCATPPEENVTPWKQRKLIKTAQLYLLAKHYAPDREWQIDVIAVELNYDTRKASLRHTKNAVYY